MEKRTYKKFKEKKHIMRKKFLNKRKGRGGDRQNMGKEDGKILMACEIEKENKKQIVEIGKT